jgi:hypothetical protein
LKTAEGKSRKLAQARLGRRQQNATTKNTYDVERREVSKQEILAEIEAKKPKSLSDAGHKVARNWDQIEVHFGPPTPTRNPEAREGDVWKFVKPSKHRGYVP